MNFIKGLFLLISFFAAPFVLAEKADLCSSSLLELSKHRAFIKEFFSHPQNITQYRGQKGQIDFIEEHLSFLMMSTVFIYTSQVLLKEDMKKLNWQQYQGTTEELKEERSRILDEAGNVKEEYRGLEGYVLYADEFYGGKRKKQGAMEKTYINVSAALSRSEKINLNWQLYKGKTNEFREERLRILDETGQVKKEYRGLEGYVLYADEFYGGKKKEQGDMHKAYRNVSVVLSKSEKQHLKWQVYKGSTDEFKEERSRILDEAGNVKEEYRGLKGYILYADKFYGGKKKKQGDMRKAYENVSAVLLELGKRHLNWQIYQGNTGEIKKERSRILNEEGNVRKEYRGPRGYALYADHFYGGEKKERGDMKKAYINISAVLSKEEKELLNWSRYSGNTSEFEKERSRILDEEGNVRKEYRGPRGYALYADHFYGGEKKEQGDMKKTYINVSATLSEEEKQDFGWKLFVGDTVQFRALAEFFKSHDFEEYQGAEGQKRIASLIFNNHLINTYKNVSVLREHLFYDKDEFVELRASGWSAALSY